MTHSVILEMSVQAVTTLVTENWIQNKQKKIYRRKLQNKVKLYLNNINHNQSTELRYN